MEKNVCIGKLLAAGARYRGSRAGGADPIVSISTQAVPNVRSEPVQIEKGFCIAACVQNFLVSGSGHFKAMVGFTIRIFCPS
jgi:hypothetical protein